MGCGARVCILLANVFKDKALKLQALNKFSHYGEYMGDGFYFTS